MTTMNSINLPTGALNTVVLGQGVGSAFTSSTATYPPTTTINQLLYSSAANTITGLATGNNGVLITSAGGVPSISSTLPAAVQSNITQLGNLTSLTVGTFTITGATISASGAILISPGGGNGVEIATSGGLALTALTPLNFYNAANTFATTFTANPSIAANANYNWPLTLPASSGNIMACTTGGVMSWTTATYPATTTINQILYSSAANTVTGLATANNGVLVTSAGGVPSISNTLPSAVTANIPGRLLSYQFLTSGTGATYTKNASATSILVECFGGGGGGGGTSSTNTTFGSGGGGGGGGYVRKYITSAASTYTYTIGAGGTAGAVGNNAGGNGGATTFSGSSLSAGGGTGGGGGQGAAASVGTIDGNPGAGGTSSGGDINYPGASGGFGINGNTLGNIAIGGFGGSCGYSGGASATVTTGSTPVTGNAGTANSGGGGAGGVSIANNTGAAGGAGGSGFIIVWEFS